MAAQQGYENLRKPEIAALVTQKTEKQLTANELSASRILEEMRRLALSDTREFFDGQGNLKPMHALTAEQGSALSGVEVIIKNAKAGDGQTDTIHKIRCWDKTRALEMLGKYFGLLKEHVQHEGGIELKWQS